MTEDDSIKMNKNLERIADALEKILVEVRNL